MSIDLSRTEVRQVAIGFEIAIEGRPIRTPAGAPLIVPSAALAEAIAGEWRAQKGPIKPLVMPLTRLAMTAIDRVRPDRSVAIAQILAFAGSDLLCYRAVEPAALARRQAEMWQPWVEWAARRFDVPLQVTRGIVPVPQSPAAIDALRRAIACLGEHELVVLAELVNLTGSCLLGLAAVEGETDAGALFECCQLDETFQIERWGEDAEAAKRRASLKTDLSAALRYLALARAA
jgi:chaperone required for assembly of F1-ATPase